jgi:ribosome-binding protein aMBF1 (putative translation factor)
MLQVYEQPAADNPAMTARTKLLTAPPYAVEQTLKTLGANLRTARLRRNFTLEDIAQKIGTRRAVVADAEKGKPSTAIAVYMAILWALDLLEPVEAVAAPERDAEGQALALAHERSRARPKTGVDDDF